MSRSVKKPHHFWNEWWKKKPWKYNRGGYGGRRYKIYRKILQKKFRQATRQALSHHQEAPALPPFNWWLID